MKTNFDRWPATLLLSTACVMALWVSVLADDPETPPGSAVASPKVSPPKVLPPGNSPKSQDSVVSIFSAEADTLEARRARVAQLSDAEKHALRRKFERFKQLKPEDQAHLRKLEADLAQDPEADQLRRIMARYGGWLATLPATSRAELGDLPPSQRIAKIKEILRKQEMFRPGQWPGSKLNRNDVDVLVNWIDQFVFRHEAAMLSELKAQANAAILRAIENVADEHRRRLMLYRLYMRHVSQRSVHPTTEDLDELMKDLSPEAQQSLNEISDPRARLGMALGWVRWVLLSRFGPQVPKEELERFFYERLSPQKQDDLENMPIDRMRMELTRLYFQDRFNSAADAGRGRPRPRE